jgi:PqqD family protein of HPr-rel-A system
VAAPRYIADARDQLRVVELDGLTAMFHEPSGMTHIVAPPAPQILDALSEGPADAREILRRIMKSFEVDAAEGAQAVEARLAELEAAGLVSRL